MEKTITHYLLEARTRTNNPIAIKYKKNKKWQSVAWKEFYNSAQSVGNALLKLGVKKSDRVAVMCNTRYEWALADLGILGIGAVTVPIYVNNHSTDIEFIINNSEAKILICEDEEQLSKWLEIAEKCPSITKVICIDKKQKSSTVFSWEQFLDLGNEYAEESPTEFEDLCSQNTLEDVATILYTSGTTGTPKGVTLTHRQIMSEAKDAFELVHINENDVSLSFLPYAHVLGRVELWGCVYVGYTLAFAESIEKMPNNLKEIRPTFIIGVPRIFEKIYAAIQNQVESHALKKKVFEWALKSGTEVSKLRRKKKPLPIHLLAQYITAKKLVFQTITDKLGGNLKYAISGGAPLSKEVAEFFHAAGLLVLEGYGLTETTAAVFGNSPFEYKFGTVGKPLGDVQIKFADDGEILIKSDKVMKGYYKNEEATKAAIKDGYFATGDIGKLDSEGFLVITDRKKDLIKTAGGKYVAPQRLENLLKLSQYVSNVHVHGDKKKYVVALITLDKPNIENFANKQSINYRNFDSLVKNEKVQSLVRDVVANTNESLASFESIKNYAILPKDFTVESGELTPSLKVKRKVCDQKFKDVLDTLY